MKKVSLPKIGIRPVIDGRRLGVRESLESKTMNMASSVAKFLSENLKHSCGLPVECVIADTSIAGIVENNICEEKFRYQNVGVTITVTPCWCYGSETIDVSPLRPKAIWGFNGTERPGAVYLSAALAAHNQKGLPAFSIYSEDVQDAGDSSIPRDVQKKLVRFARAGLVVAFLKDKNYLSIGGVSMGIAGSIVDQRFFESWLGMKVQTVDMTELKRRIDFSIYDDEEMKIAMLWVEKYLRFSKDASKDVYKKYSSKLRESILMAICIRDMMQGNSKLALKNRIEESLGYDAVAAGFQGQRHWTDQYSNGDFAETILNSSFDWNGIREPLVLATENDSLNSVSMLFGRQLTGTAQVFADMRTYWSPQSVLRVTGHALTGRSKKGIIHLTNSGSAAMDGSCQQKSSTGHPTMKPHWELDQEDVEACLKAVTWHPAIQEYFCGGGFSSSFLTVGDVPFTMTRINIVKGIGPIIQIIEGWSITLPQDVHLILDKRTNPTWPTTWFAPRLTPTGKCSTVYSIMNNWGANHSVLTIGHTGAEFITLASMLRIPVCMHNIQESEIYRPSCWSAHGITSDTQDYLACRNYGPLYR